MSMPVMSVCFSLLQTRQLPDTDMQQALKLLSLFLVEKSSSEMAIIGKNFTDF